MINVKFETKMIGKSCTMQTLFLKTTVVILISDKGDFKMKKITKDRKGH